jgi:hypothetical protein
MHKAKTSAARHHAQGQDISRKTLDQGISRKTVRARPEGSIVGVKP